TTDERGAAALKTGLVQGRAGGTVLFAVGGICAQRIFCRPGVDSARMHAVKIAVTGDGTCQEPQLDLEHAQYPLLMTAERALAHGTRVSRKREEHHARDSDDADSSHDCGPPHVPYTSVHSQLSSQFLWACRCRVQPKIRDTAHKQPTKKT